MTPKPEVPKKSPQDRWDAELAKAKAQLTGLPELAGAPMQTHVVRWLDRLGANLQESLGAERDEELRRRLLGHCHTAMMTGLRLGATTQQDRAAAVAGKEAFKQRTFETLVNDLNATGSSAWVGSVWERKMQDQIVDALDEGFLLGQEFAVDRANVRGVPEPEPAPAAIPAAPTKPRSATIDTDEELPMVEIVEVPQPGSPVASTATHLDTEFGDEPVALSDDQEPIQGVPVDEEEEDFGDALVNLTDDDEQ